MLKFYPGKIILRLHSVLLCSMYKCVFVSLLLVSCRYSGAVVAQFRCNNPSSLEDSMKPASNSMIMAPLMEDRLVADSVFTRNLVKALRVPYSFSYPFDSILTVSKIYAPDSSFRIFTWQFERDESYFRHRGAIQMKTADGSLQSLPASRCIRFYVAANRFCSQQPELDWRHLLWHCAKRICRQTILYPHWVRRQRHQHHAQMDGCADV